MIDTKNLSQLKDLNIADKVLLIREDLNAPIAAEVVTSDARLKATLPTLTYALEQGAKIILLSHLGRPNEGEFDRSFSLQPIATHLSNLLKLPIPLIDNWQTQPIDFSHSPIVMLENVRFNQGEKANDEELAKSYADLADIVVMDAFGTAHRAQSSTEGMLRFAQAAPNKQCCAGPLMHAELTALNAAIAAPQRPLIAIVGGSKISTKLDVLTQLIELTDQLIVGGGIANTLLAASGYNVGQSLYEPSLIDTAKQLLATGKILMPTDVVVGKSFSKDAAATTVSVDAVADDDMILDVGEQSAILQRESILQAKTLLWNGPVGVFEFPNFASGTQSLAFAIAESSAFSVAGGGDTLAVIDKYKITDKISYISTGGGAFLEYIEGKTLPAIAALINH